MNIRDKCFNALLALVLVVTSSLPVSTAVARGADEVRGLTSSDAMVIDALIIRPVMLVTTVVGVAAFVVSLPFTVPSDSVGKAGEVLVKEPAAYTFTRPLGELE